jgi:uncharacterized membrane protein
MRAIEPVNVTTSPPTAVGRVNSPRTYQRGSMAVTMMLMLAGLIAMLGLVEIGYLYWAKRETQKVVDLSALAGAQQLAQCAADNSSNTAALGNATVDNGFTGTLAIACGYWDPGQPGAQHFATATAQQPTNAVRVQAALPLVPFFGFAHFSSVSATAIATGGQPIASLSVGSRLLGLSPNGPLNQLLSSTLGTSLGLNLLSYQGIANTDVSLLGLKNLIAANAGTVDDVLNTSVTVSQFLNAYVSLLDQSPNSAQIDFNFVNTQIALIEAQLGSTAITLGDILNVNADTTDPTTALGVNVNAADILSAVLQAANSKNAVALQALNVNLLGLANVNVALTIVEPPKIAVGVAGYNADGTPITEAHTAQVRLQANVSALNAGNGSKSLLSLLLVQVTLPANALVSIPLNVEVVPATAWLDTIACHVPASGGGVTQQVTVKAQPGIADVFLGNLPASAYSDTTQNWDTIIGTAIANGSAYANLLAINVYVLGIPIGIGLQAYSHVPVVSSSVGEHVFTVDPNTPIAQQAGMTWTTQTGTTLLTSVLQAVTNPALLNIRLNPAQTGLISSVLSLVVNSLSVILTNLLGVLGPLLSPVLSTLDSALIDPLLNVLGIDVGAADVNLLSVNCDNGAQLVY